MLTFFIVAFKFQDFFLLKVCCLQVEECLEKSSLLLVLNEKSQNFVSQERVCSLWNWLSVFYSTYRHMCTCIFREADLGTS